MRNETQQHAFFKLKKVVCITSITTLAMVSFLTNLQQVSADTIKGHSETQINNASSDNTSQVSASQAEKSETITSTSTVQSANITEATAANSSNSSSATEKSADSDKQISDSQDKSKVTGQAIGNTDKPTAKVDQPTNKPVIIDSSEQSIIDKSTPVVITTPKNGFVTENGQTKYYQNDVKVTGEKKIDNNWYNFDSQGNQSNGLTKLAKKTVYYDNNGKMHYGYLSSGSTYMFFDLFDGHATTGLRKYNQGLEYYGQDFKQVRNNYVRTNAKTIYFFGANGDAVKGSRKYGNNQMEYYSNDYNQVRNNYVRTNAKTIYFFGANGDAIKGSRKYGNNQMEYYSNDHNQVRNNYVRTNAKTIYFFGANGDAVRGTRYYGNSLSLIHI